MRVDLNSDLGESWGAYELGADADMLSIVSSANVACGFHAGDPNVMRETVIRARDGGVGIGAHPGYLDLWGFGRRKIAGDSLADLEKQTAYQIGALMGLAALEGVKVTHVKTHGALGNLVAEDESVAGAIARATKSVDPDLILVVMPGMATERAGEAAGLRLAREIFADRAYQDNGNLVPRSEPGAVIHDAEAAAASVLAMLEESAVITRSGKRIKGRVDTICVHGDNPAGVQMARALRTSLEAAGIEIAPFHHFL
ncbi:LamB/YcsF family protein [Nisaea nitritireducens]|uniref:LamB/YcsF family protein n=1 Tax=Nisaea nitritireducens TaxID=568392 RepID=UPI001865EB49|nr:5-oxoprolinase subunit PxpA [Nisaea nitritireducens]